MTRVPLSRAYTHTAWPVAAFNVMSKPGGAACNMACEYCFYRHHQDDAKAEKQKTESRNRCSAVDDRGDGGAALVSDELLERFIADYIASQDNFTVFFTWQGGEPTLAGIQFYQRVVELHKKHARPGIKVLNALQTNGVLLDEAWCRFLAESRWAVGISIDGPAEVHDRYRRTRGGAGFPARP